MNKSVFITGATVNTGLGIAEKFAKEGYDVFAGSRSEEKAQKVAEMLTEKYGVYSKGYGMKIFDESDVIRIFDDIKKQGYLIDCLVLNAANLGIKQKFFDVPVEEFMDVINTNVGWNFMLSRQAALQMKEKGGGSIVFINSNTAYRAIPDRVSYSASKSGALGMMRAMALDLGKYNIRVNAVLPGMIKTDRWENNYNDCRSALSNYTPLGDIADFEDIANAAFYFGSDLSKNATGAELTVDGGNMIQLYPIIEK
ncbi:MAG: SDR family oxidoreductase [Clostridia bacterium]|nr:SDR family oxidoreductase [Oscillospiraceae bacterium]MDY5626326.1 SDR family oxidoreductase [Clostridia bacterium]